MKRRSNGRHADPRFQAALPVERSAATWKRCAASLLAGFWTLVGACVYGDEAARPMSISDWREAQAILSAKCWSCHGPDKQEGDLRLDNLAAARRGGVRGPAVVPEDVAKSLLVRAVEFTDSDLQMPPKQKLTSREIETLTRWVKAGAVWPDPVVVLFEDDVEFPKLLTNGNGRLRMVRDRPHAGEAALGVTPLQRDNPRIPGWRFDIREKPRPGEYRFLRLAWKKRGAGSVMLELASNGQWPDAKSPRGRYVAGPNSTGWAAVSVSGTSPREWSVVTFDLWRDIGDFTLTGCAPTCDGGEEAFFDSLLLGPTRESLDAYSPSEASNAPPSAGTRPLGDAFTDSRNPIRTLFRGERLEQWSLRKPVRPPTPSVVGVTHPIDAFVRAAWGDRPLTPSVEADRRTLIRRLSFDLTGLPPTPDEVDAFVADESPQAYESLVERLLDSPAYGERQARLWLDVVRYADTNGYERDEFRPLIWKYRDYVIRAFNQDKPYDEFVREQLAGDELQSGSPRTAAEADRLIATGYLRLGQWDSTAAIFQEEERLRAEMLADLTNTTASAFLGLTMSCCQCHDHKYDPLSQADHYRLRAFFAGVTPRDETIVSYGADLDEIERIDAELKREAAPLREELAKTAKDDKSRRAELEAKLAAIAARERPAELAMTAGDVGESLPATHLLYQGDFSSRREVVSPGFVSALDPNPAVVEPPRDGTSGRRLTLARWITSPDNPWTARVLVNRVWQQHFGAGLVATPNDFGFSGARPSHPALLDWLASDFMEQGWSLKRLHRRIVTSDTYRQSSRVADAAGERAARIDPENRLLWRQNMRRLDAETIRDALLSVSGRLLPYAGGKPLWPPVPEELLKAQPAILEAEKGGDGGRRQGWYADPDEATDVRSVFLVRKRCLPIPFLQAFDLPDTTVSCARRDVTVVAPQALMLLNSPESVRYARALAARVAGDAAKLDATDAATAEQVTRRAFRLVLQRAPSPEEVRLAGEFLRGQAARPDSPPARPDDKTPAKPDAGARAIVELCRALLNLNEFAYAD